MRWSDIYVNTSAAVLGAKEDTAAAVASGRYDPEFHAAHGYRSVCVAENGLLVDMAVDAARAALSRSEVNPADIKLVVHAGSTPQGPDDLVPASYIQGKAVKGTACAIEVKQTCNGALASLELAAAYLAACPAGSSALLTTSDRHAPADTDRYRSDPGSVDADGATGLVLSRGNGVARLLSTVVVGDGGFSDLGVATGSQNYPDRKTFLAEQRKRLLPLLESMAALQRESVESALADAESDRTEISRWVFPNIGANMIDREFRRTFGIEVPMTTWDWGRTVGHLGTGNQFGGFTHLVEAGTVRVGDRVALCGNGLGFSYGCAILEIVGEPHWPSGEND